MVFSTSVVSSLDETKLSTKYFATHPDSDCPTATSIDSRTRYLEVLHEFALSQVNLNSLDEILWNVAKTAIAKLGFVDCVIYLIDDDGSTLVQKAAHGPKNPVQQEIYNPITIAVGDGIVGAVAQSGEIEVVSDTRQDSRYIVDDATRLSELAVPIIHDGSVIGVLDSEHPEPGFFTEEHVRLLTTIASLAATRIDTALAIENLQSTVGRLSVAEKDLEKKAKELEKAKLEADRASVEKSQFLANMSHEIRTPMTAVLGYAELLTRPDKSAADKEDWISHIHLNASHLLGLVNDVLDLSRIESGEFHANIQNCRLDKLITDVVALMRPRAEERGLSFNVSVAEDLPSTIRTDPLRFRQALINLLSNAVKYTVEGSVDLRVWGEWPGENKPLDLYCQVSDSGHGISAQEKDHIFEPFVRVDDPDKKIAGAGLGLAIVFNIAKLLGGNVELDTEPGKGSKFTLHITCEVVRDQADAAAEKPGTGESRANYQEPAGNQLAGRVIHIIEDSLAIARVIRLLLEDAGAEVRHSADGLEGVEQVLASRNQGALPDIVLMDMQMPNKDGYTAAAELRQEGVKIPIVAMTAAAFSDDRDKCLAAGCDAYLSKPIDPANFVHQISDYLV